ncbi:DcaP family trimeric outer membrane transporter [Eilatimonas milleporae]|uniref:Porin n=1 Tax=Eilatimonas milleporae TaxID=911205 RepID=A0A3M0CUD8_9PROT|nr:DcaP family trimeric outer membrane transporter [Eilatimonas milleporae]RMB13012.1 hypothetical protein BXY39_0002 [Eilatimonas milleporae]
MSIITATADKPPHRRAAASVPARRAGAVRRRAAALLITTGLVHAGLAMPLAAQEDTPDLADRVAALEATLAKILARLEDQDAKLSVQEIQIVEQASRLVQTEQKVEETEERVIQVANSTPFIQERPEEAGGFQMGDTNVQIHGYVKLDTIFSNFSDGVLGSSNIGRDFYIPGLVPVAAEDIDSDWVNDFNPRETRLLIDTDTPIGDHKVSTRIELDFQVTGGGDERISNSFVPRMRQAYIRFDDWLLGQAWSTFQDVSALPDNLDFIGPTEGTVFERQPMIRYTKGPWELALEQAETTVTTRDGGRILSGSDPVPDAVVRYTSRGDWGHVRLAGILRNLNIEENMVMGAAEDSALAYGLTLSGKLKVGRKGSDFRFMGTVGEGLGRYVGLNLVNSAGLRDDGTLDPITSYSGFASYRHMWEEKWRSNLTFGYFKADNPVRLTTMGVTDESWSVHANLIYSLASRLDVGVEYTISERTLENGLSGSLNRVQFSTKFSF